jgi:hypothetical protein
MGPSMNPILRAGDRLHIVPYDGQEVRRGDVIVFMPPEGGVPKVVHRVISADPQGIRTRGDNSKGADRWVLSPDQVLGRVVCAQSGNRRRRVVGGPMGRVLGGTVRAIHLIDWSASYLLRPIYHWLARAGLFRRWMPVQMKTRIITFSRPAGTELQLLVGPHVVGRRLPGEARWHIRRPFRLFVDEQDLARGTGREAK